MSNNRQVKKAMILAGGFGTRFLPATLCLAKELFPIGNKPIIMYHLEDLLKAGVTDILVVGNEIKRESIMQFLQPSAEYLARVGENHPNLNELKYIFNNMNIQYIDQPLDLRGSAMAIATGIEWAGDDPFVVLNGDDLCFYEDGRSVVQDVIDTYTATGNNVVFGKKVPAVSAGKYSAMVVGDQVGAKSFNVQSIIEKPNETDLEKVIAASAGKQGLTNYEVIMSFAKYVLDRRFMEAIFTTPMRSNGEVNMTDTLAYFATQGQVSTSIFDGIYFDCGSERGYASANMYAVDQAARAASMDSPVKSEASSRGNVKDLQNH